MVFPLEELSHYGRKNRYTHDPMPGYPTRRTWSELDSRNLSSSLYSPRDRTIGGPAQERGKINDRNLSLLTWIQITFLRCGKWIWNMLFDNTRDLGPSLLPFLPEGIVEKVHNFMLTVSFPCVKRSRLDNSGAGARKFCHSNWTV